MSCFSLAQKTSTSDSIHNPDLESSSLSPMANHNSDEATSDDFLEQFLGFQGYATGTDNEPPASAAMMLQLGSSHLGGPMGVGFGGAPGIPLGLSLDQGKAGFLDAFDPRGASAVKPVFHGNPMSNTIPTATQPPTVRPRVRARRGQATDPHSIAERLRRERIAERIRALQDLVPSVNRTDRAAMLDEIVEYVKFLRLQVKVLSMSRLGGAGAVAPLVTDIPVSTIEDEGRTQPAWEKWSNDGTERQVAKLMEENVGDAMQFLQTKALCLMPISLASAIYHAHPPDTVQLVKPEPNPNPNPQS